ncbi:MAG: phosphotransferase enzyme family protein [Thermomicrobiales bacterium]
MDSGEEHLAGDVSTVVRSGDAVLRTTGPWSPAVHALLMHLEASGFEGSPRFLGIDKQGRERLTRLSFIAGDVVHHPTPDVMTEEALVELGRLLRCMHDMAADFRLPSDLAWAHAPETEVPGEVVVCHNDLSPKNVIFRAGLPVAFIDWDLAAPAPRVWDLAHCVWQFVPLVIDAGWITAGWSEPAPLLTRLNRVRALVDGYALDPAARVRFGRIVALRMERTATGIASLADAGEPAFVRFREQGVIAEIDAARTWVLQHLTEIDAARLD